MMTRRLMLPLLGGLLMLSLIEACREPEGNLSVLLDEQLLSLLDVSSDGQGVDWYIMPESDDLAAIPQDPNNPLTAEKVELGQFLFHESGIGTRPEAALGARTYSCASCHHAAGGFQAGKKQGIGEGGLGFGLAGEGRYKHPIYMQPFIDVQPIRTPSAMNVAYQECILWNGQFGATGINEGTEYAWTEHTPRAVNNFGFHGLESQAIAGQEVHRLDMTEDLADELGYRELFDAAFPEVDESKRYHRNYAGLAIAAYERTLFSSQAPFQLWLKGDMEAMTDRETEGALLFFGKGQCVNCHNGPALANMEFHALGMHDLNGPGVFNANPDAPENRGRQSFTLQESDRYTYKVPQLYNMKDSPFFGHGGSFTSLVELIEYKNRAIKENPLVPEEYLSEQFVPIGLAEDEIEKIAAFMANALYDPSLDRYVPSSLPSGLCFPNNDHISRQELGCE